MTQECGGRSGFNDEWPAVAWNSTSDQFLVAWRDERNLGTRGWEIYGRQLDQRGIRVGRDFRINGPAAAEHEYRPATAWNSTSNQYLVVWHDSRDPSRGYDIHGRRATGWAGEVERAADPSPSRRS